MSIWRHHGKELVLASTSPRRFEILEKMGLEFSIISPYIEDENSYLSSSDIENSVCRLAEAKAESVAVKSPSKLVIGADTIVFFDGKILGKPESRKDAADMLSLLSDRVHTVYTGVSLIQENCDFKMSVCAATDVKFRKIDNEIDEYLDLREYSDKAGAYAIQGSAITFVEKIDGCFYNVMGLPVAQVIFLLESYVMSGKD